MPDHIVRMYQEAQDRLHDADILAQSLCARSDSQAIIRILAFEVLLKCALLICGQKPKAKSQPQLPKALAGPSWLRSKGSSLSGL